jgi:phosphoribosylformimino-5-aminoimidazole carboxamide ribotide isomerase
VARVVVGLETVDGPDVLAETVDALGDRVVFSLDLRDGQLLGNVPAWPLHDADGIAAYAVSLGVRRILVLDLARVGVGSGLGTEKLCGLLAEEFPKIEIYAGGGVRGIGDLRRLRYERVRGALVASALHDGLLSREDLAGL